MTDFKEIFEKAKAAAQSAAEAKNAELGPEGGRGFDCGFAWVMIRPARGPFVAFLKSIGVGSYPGFDRRPSYGLWYSSVTVHEAAVMAFVAAVRDHAPMEVTWSSRLD